MTSRIFLDFETFSESNLPKIGAVEYAKHATTEAMMLAYAVDDGKVKQWVPAETDKPIPNKLFRKLRDPDYVKSAWNWAFEAAIFKHTLDIEIPIEQCQCSMALAMTLSLPGQLSKAGEVVGIDGDKQKLSRGKALVRKFCMPRKPTKLLHHTRADMHTDPEDWEEFLLYNRIDIEAERAIYEKIRKYDMPEHEWRLWRLDQQINERGMPINVKGVKKAINLRDRMRVRDMAELTKITQLANPNSQAQMLEWARTNGYKFEDLKKGHVEQEVARQEARRDHPDADILGFKPTLLDALNIRLRIAKAAVKKFDMYLDGAGVDALLRGCFQFAGAGRTWRWAGRRVQPQNLPRPARWLKKIIVPVLAEFMDMSAKHMMAKYSPAEVMDILTTILRPMIAAPKGMTITSADLNAIENRILGWLARDDKILEVFRENRCPYVSFAVYMYDEPYEKLWAEYIGGDDEKRTAAKPGVLGCMGPNTLVLTNRGWREIQFVTTEHLVHDGTRFVAHDGLLKQGVKEVVNFGGLMLTPDHRVMTGRTPSVRWTEAGDATSQTLRDATWVAKSHLRPNEYRDEQFKRVMGTGFYLRHKLPKPEWTAEDAPAPAGQMETYDIANAGANHRFVVMSSAGPMIVHNCGYLLGPGMERENPTTGEMEATGLLGYGRAIGVDLTPAMAELSVDTFRSTFLGVKQFWYDLDDAMRACIKTKKRQRVGYLEFDMKGPMLRIKLPSGRYLHYVRPKILERMTPWGEKRPTITYENLQNGRWIRVTTHPGKIAENVTQAVARDVLAHGMLLVDQKGLPIFLHVHDEIAVLSKKKKAKRDLKTLIKCMVKRPPWADKHLPLAAEGGVSPVFLKE